MKATKGKNILEFYNLTDYNIWKDTPEAIQYKIKYYIEYNILKMKNRK